MDRVEKTQWGAIFEPDGKAAFRLWGPAVADIHLLLPGARLPMSRDEEGWHWLSVEGCVPGDEYMFELPGGRRVPDPASRYQPRGVEGPSVLTDPQDYRWLNTDWNGRPWHEAIIYELHIGAFTPEGTFAAATERLAWIASLGFTAIEIMPLSHFPGERGWGYDGVYPFAPYSGYGSPAELKALIDTAHGLGLMVLLDVVYNHFGPVGNFLPLYAPDFFCADSDTPWGKAIAFEQPAVRRFFLDNIRYWLSEFRIDGFRFDAVDQIRDGSELHIMQEIANLVALLRDRRFCHLVTEDASNGQVLKDNLRKRFNADWNDDFHHALHVAVTGEDKGHYQPFAESAWHRAGDALAHGYLRKGEEMRPSPSPGEVFSPTAYVHFLQNHDQVGNRAHGDRLYRALGPGIFKCLTEILLLSPQIPLFFMGDDHLSRRPFLFFADMGGEPGERVHQRLEEALKFGGLTHGISAADISDPADSTTFTRSKLDWSDAGHTRPWSAFLRRLIALRREHVLPLLATRKECVGRNLSNTPEFLWLEWKFGEALMALQANLSAEPRAISAAPGALVYPHPPRREGFIEAWTCHFYVPTPGVPEKDQFGREQSRRSMVLPL